MNDAFALGSLVQAAAACLVAFSVSAGAQGGSIADEPAWLEVN
jgi:hypothetical protein